jgi:hypothetical protein
MIRQCRWWMPFLFFLASHHASAQEASLTGTVASTNARVDAALDATVDTPGIALSDVEKSSIVQRLQSEDVIERVARVSLPILMEADEAAATTLGTEEEPFLTTLSFQASQVAALRHWRGNGETGKSLPLDIGTDMEWDEETETYSFSSVKLELLGERLWIVRDLREDSDEEWNLGVQFKRTW